MNNRCSFHNHTYYSNLRLLDALSSPEALMDRAIELGINYLGITEHESLSSHVRINKYTKVLQEKNKDFHTILGNEIYLTDTRDKNQKTYYHHILLAKDAVGHQLLRELSSIAWMNSYFSRGLQRVPTLKDELAGMIKKYGKGHIISSTACIGSRLGQNILTMHEAEIMDNYIGRKKAYDEIVDFVEYNLNLFGDDFYFEIAPALYEDQIYVNKKTIEIANVYEAKVTVQDDSHRLTQDDYTAHKALLNSKSGEREDIDNFYAYTYLQSYDDIRKHLAPIDVDVDQLFLNSIELAKKCEDYSLLHSQQVPQVSVPNYPIKKQDTGRPNLDYLYQSDNIQERYWVNYCINKLKEKKLDNDIYLDELEHEAKVQRIVGQKLDTCIFSYPIFLQHYFDLIWECGGCIGTGRGSSSAGLDNYLMGLTQYDPIKSGVNNYFRYLNENRTELPDLDFDLPPSVRPKWFDKIREERGETNLLQVCTFSTMSSRAAILAAARGYRSEDYPMGIDNDTAQYLTSLIGSERGFTYSIKDMIEGNEEKGLKPNKEFIRTVNSFPGLLNIILKLEGVISARSQHASGVIFTEPGHEYDYGAIMTAPDGTLLTQFSLHDSEAMGNVKIDALVTDVMEKITQCLLLLQEYGKIEKDLTLKQLYDKYIHPDVLPLDDDEIWDEIDKCEINSLFQLNTAVGSQAVKLLKPRTVNDLAAINALIRLMAQEKGAETPLQRYSRIQHHPEDWDEEMDSYGLTKEEKDIIKEYCAETCGTLPLQDDLMLMMMDERLFGFDLDTTNNARAIIGKKKMNEIPALHEKVLQKAKSPALGKYIWEVLFSEQLGYAFNREHTFSYSLIGFQCAYLATKFNPIYWNTACVRVDGGLGVDDVTSYNKVAKALGAIQEQQGIKISTININKSQQSFSPDENNNTIIYGLKCLNGVGGEITETIVENRPYISVEDFQKKVKVNKTVMLSLIKSGAFDEFAPREKVMEKYLRQVSEPKKRITLQNFKGLVDANLLPQEFNFHKRLFIFNKALKANCKNGLMYAINGNYYDFYEEFFDISLLEPLETGLGILQKTWDKIYKDKMQEVSNYFKKNQKEILEQYNNYLFKEQWNKYANGNISAWEMESLGFYAHEHELINVDKNKYGIVDYKALPSEPVAERYYKKNGIEFPVFKTTRIIGTVIAKDNIKSIVSILVPNGGIVDVKFNRDYYAKYNQRLSELQEDGTKKVIEAGWFQRGALIMVNGFRRGDNFVARANKKTNSHQLYKITEVHDDGTISITNARYGEEE